MTLAAEPHDATLPPEGQRRHAGQPRDGGLMASYPESLISTASRVTAWLLGPLTAVQFLTILPLTVRRPTRPHELGPAEAFFPFAGLLIGALLVAIDRLLSGIASGLVVDVLLVAAVAAVTGALHLDGVIDTFDGVFAPGGPARRLEIMRDPRAGSFGVIAVVLLLGLKVAALGSLSTDVRTGALLLGPCVGRWTIVVVTSVFPYARPVGSGRAFKDAIRPIHVAVAGLITALTATLAVGWAGLLVAGIITVLGLILGRWCSGRLGGLAGDNYGAACELAETTTWLLLGLKLAGPWAVAFVSSTLGPGGIFG
jgi:adenosylcobinamide-GDP ribazoletransferase